MPAKSLDRRRNCLNARPGGLEDRFLVRLAGTWRESSFVKGTQVRSLIETVTIIRYSTLGTAGVTKSGMQSMGAIEDGCAKNTSDGGRKHQGRSPKRLSDTPRFWVDDRLGPLATWLAGIWERGGHIG